MGNKDERPQWAETKLCGIGVEFMLSCIGYAVGLGNVWRFPYRMAQNGGGAFLIPYVIMLICCGIPLVFLELAFGQFSALGPVTAWNSIPLFKGIGWAMVYVSWIVTLYYNLVIAYAVFYLFSCFQKKLPWTHCDNNYYKSDISYNTENCARGFQTGNYSSFNSSQVLPAQEYWYYRVLKMDQSEGMYDVGAPMWDLTLCNLFAWAIVFFCLIKGVQSSGKVVYFTATFPYVVLVILFGAGIWREGAGDGIKFYLGIGDPLLMEKLKNPSAWSGAASQIFYSLGVAFGGLLTMSSYNKFNNNISRDTLLICFINCGTSVFAGFVIFSIIGHMAFLLGTDVQTIAGGGGPGLAFIAYPQAMGMMPAAHLWSILFFFMLITLGLDSQYAMVETVITGVTDEFKSLRPYKSFILLGYCITGFLLGLPMTSPGGMYWFKLVEDYSAWLGFIILAFIMLVATWFLYSELVPIWTKNPKGRGRFLRDIRMMIGPEKSWFRKIFNIYAQAMWWFATPVLLMFVIVYACMNYGSGPALSYGYKAGTYVYPTGGIVISYMLNFMPQVIILVFAIVAIRKHGFKGAFSPTNKWRAQIGAQPKVRGHVSDDYVVSPDYQDNGFENKAME